MVRRSGAVCRVLKSTSPLRIPDPTPLTVLSPVHGGAWIFTVGHGPRYLHTGEVAIIRGSETYIVADDPAIEPGLIVHPARLGAHVLLSGIGGSRFEHSRRAATVLTDTYDTAAAVVRRLLHALPHIIVWQDGDFPDSIRDIPAGPAAEDRRAPDEVANRWLDLLVVAALRARLAHTDAPAWYHAYSDPLVGRALHLLHHDPAHRWTVAGPADAVGVSRAALARRFTALVGEPPMSFLTEWRLSLAADLLQETDESRRCEPNWRAERRQRRRLRGRGRDDFVAGCRAGPAKRVPVTASSAPHVVIRPRTRVTAAQVGRASRQLAAATRSRITVIARRRGDSHR
ncbi:cupin domain-containing protein [Nocardia testacea]|uniref:cupin domain-containing protein n=1 Tax=Nocardia testacea TaxID=248551 RepID=UPI003C2D3B72